MTAFISKAKRDKKSINIWRYAHLSKLWFIKISKWSTGRSDHKFYPNRRNFWHSSNFLIFVYRISQKLTKLEIWKYHKKLRTLFACNLYKLETYAEYNYAELEVKGIQFSFCNFDKVNYVLHEFVNREWIKFHIHNILLNETQNNMECINLTRWKQIKISTAFRRDQIKKTKIVHSKSKINAKLFRQYA